MNGHAELRDTAEFTTLDGFLEGQGTREEAQTLAVREVLAWQLEQAMQVAGLSREALAKLMNTSPAQVRRLLDPKDSSVTLATLQKAATIAGHKSRIDLV